MPINSNSSYTELLNALLEWNPEEFTVMDEVSNCSQGIFGLQAMFYDKHANPAFQPVQIIAQHSIVSDIREIFKDAVMQAGASGFSFPSRRPGHDHLVAVTSSKNPGPLKTGKDVANNYQDTTAAFCGPPASVFLYPRMPEWYTLFSFLEIDGNFDDPVFPVVDNWALKPPRMEASTYQKVWESLDVDDVDALRAVNAQHRALATWIFLPCNRSSESFLKDMENICSGTSSFSFDNHPTSKAQIHTTYPLSPDAHSPPWKVPPFLQESTIEKIPDNPSRRSSRLLSDVTRKPSGGGGDEGVVLIPGLSKYRSSFRAYDDPRNIVQRVCFMASPKSFHLRFCLGMDQIG
jgi:hypothetical protein